MNERDADWVFCSTGARVCALPVRDVIETLRPLPIERLPGSPAFVRGVSIIRGVPTPVIDAATLLGGSNPTPARLVTLRCGERTLALAVSAVLGVRKLPPEGVEELSPLLGANAIRALASLDSRLLLVLETARIVPESVWQRMDAEAEAR